MRDYSIAAVSKLTGVSCHTLRIWERRYGFPVPLRSASGQRRYSADVVESLREVSDAVREGARISVVVEDFKARSPAAPAGASAHRSEANLVLDDFLGRIKAGDGYGAGRLLDDWERKYQSMALIVDLIEPAMVEVGERWFLGEFRVFQERLATSLLHRTLAAVLERAKRENPNPLGLVLLCSITGERHDGAIKIVAPVLELAGWRTETLGVDLPVSELELAVEAWKPTAVGVSFVLSRNINKRFAELSAIKDVPVLVGGRSLTNYHRLAERHGLIPIDDDLASLGATCHRKVASWQGGRRRSG